MKHGKKIITLTIGLALMMSACGKKEEEKKETTQSAPAPTASTPAATPATPPPPPPPPALPVKFEDASPGTPLSKSTDFPKASFELMAKNLGGTKWAKVSLESTYDYIIKGLYSETPSFAKGPNENVAKTFLVPSYHLEAGGFADGLTIHTTGNYADPGNAYSFQYEIQIGGLTLYSTESVALFQAGNGMDILKVNYTTTTPAIQRFRISELYNYGSNSKWIIFQQNYETKVEFAPDINN